MYELAPPLSADSCQSSFWKRKKMISVMMLVGSAFDWPWLSSSSLSTFPSSLFRLKSSSSRPPASVTSFHGNKMSGSSAEYRLLPPEVSHGGVHGRFNQKRRLWNPQRGESRKVPPTSPHTPFFSFLVRLGLAIHLHAFLILLRALRLTRLTSRGCLEISPHCDD